MERQLVESVLRYLKRKISEGLLDEDRCASLEVAYECISSVFEIKPADLLMDEKYGLLDIFERGATELGCKKVEVSDKDRQEAEAFKDQGNNQMRENKHVEALDLYTKAIKLNPTVAIYYSNRSAAHYKLGQFEAALKDGKTAVELSPDYAQAYGRVGSACLALKRHREAVDAFQTAVKLDDTKAAFKENLELAIRECGSAPNLGDMLNNPEIIQLASQLMENSNVQSMVNNIMSGQSGDMSSILQMGQQFADQLRQSSPDIMEQIQSAFRNNNPDAPGGNNNN